MDIEMKKALLAAIEKKMYEFIEENCDETEWPLFYVHPKLHIQMAHAAAQVLSSSVDGQKYASKEGVQL